MERPPSPCTVRRNISASLLLFIVPDGRPSGGPTVGAAAERAGEGWIVTQAVMSRSARRPMDGPVFVPSE